MLGLKLLADVIVDERQLKGKALADFRALVDTVMEMGQKPTPDYFTSKHPDARQAFELFTSELCPS